MLFTLSALQSRRHCHADFVHVLSLPSSDTTRGRYMYVRTWLPFVLERVFFLTKEGVQSEES